MSAADFIAKLSKVTQCTPDRWRAVCPAHESKHQTQSLAVRELPDGTLLLKCFAGCGAADVVAAVGMELRDLFPQTNKNADRRSCSPNHWHAAREALQTLHKEVLIVAIAAESVMRGEALSEANIDRVAIAVGLIRSAAEACK